MVDNMRNAAMLWTGGKDSSMAMYETEQHGYCIRCLVTFAPPEPDFLAHPLGLIKMQAQALALPHYIFPISAPFEKSYKIGLCRLRDEMGIKCVVTGDIAEVNGNPNWIRERSRPIGMRVHTPLWGRERNAMLRQLLDRGFTARIPYISHLLSVSVIVMRNGGDEEQAIAALLHDSVEDQGGINLLSDIESKFGARVAKIVRQCSDSFEKQKPPWDQRKKAYVASIAHKSDDAILISKADKVDNARTILNNYRKIGEKLWERFRRGREGNLWYYRACVDAFGNRSNSDLYQELADLVSQIEDIAAGGQINQRK